MHDSSVSSSPRLVRIARLSRAMMVIAHAGAILLPIGLALLWTFVPVEVLASQAHFPVAWLTPFGATQRLLGLVITLLPAGCLVWALWRIRSCFAGFARGTLFTAAAARGFRDFALGLLLSALLQPVATIALGVLLSWNAPPGMKQLVIALSSETVLTLFLAGLVAIIGWVLAEAAVIADEHAQFV